ncbi:MAG: DUF4157 domain-containing protein [Anaerolineae bacterium]|nr:DUF4157 domain-containing protein [Anaerolineae bacterium]
MSKEFSPDEKRAVKRPNPIDKTDKQHSTGPTAASAGMMALQQTIGNRAVQRLVAQRSGDGGFALDDETAGRINQARGGGQALDSQVQQKMGGAMGHDFSDVRVHTSGEADTLNQELGAKAFTTGQDIFFKEGAYSPGSSSGQELIAHELTHVVQQSTGSVSSSGSGMVVNPPDDVYEQEADAMAQQATSLNVVSEQSLNSDAVQREEMPEEEELQMKADETIQREDALEEEELQMKADETIQREEELEEEELQMKADEAVQREEMPEEEELS